MGIKRLMPFLKTHGALKAFQGFKAGTKVAVDVPIFAHKFIYVERTYDGLVRRFHQFARDLQSKHVEPIFVFDGTDKLQLKDAERAKRAVARDKQLDRNAAQASRLIEELSALTNIEIPDGPISFGGIMFPTKYEYALLQESLKGAGYEVAQAKYEAEALCAHLSALGTVSTVLTEDTDAVAFGAKSVVFKFTSLEPMEYCQDEALQALGLTMDQLVDLCCLFGCDFCDNIFNVGPVGAYDLLKKHTNWNDIYESKKYTWSTKTLDSANVFHALYPQVKQCFVGRACEVFASPVAGLELGGASGSESASEVERKETVTE